MASSQTIDRLRKAFKRAFGFHSMKAIKLASSGSTLITLSEVLSVKVFYSSYLYRRTIRLFFKMLRNIGEIDLNIRQSVR